MEHEYLSTKEAAEMLRTTQIILRMARVEGFLYGRPCPKYFQIGIRKVLYKRSDIENFINEVNVVPPARAAAEKAAAEGEA